MAVCFLFSYLNPEHELRTEEILRDELGDIPLSLSHRLAAEWREYERTSTAVLDAYTGPAVRRYLERARATASGAWPPGAAARDAVERRGGDGAVGS